MHIPCQHLSAGAGLEFQAPDARLAQETLWVEIILNFLAIRRVEIAQSCTEYMKSLLAYLDHTLCDEEPASVQNVCPYGCIDKLTGWCRVFLLRARMPPPPHPPGLLFIQQRGVATFATHALIGSTTFRSLWSLLHRSLVAIQEHLDARLTDLGKQQCATLKATNHGVEKEAELVVVSPLTRAIQTAMLTIDQARTSPFYRRRGGGDTGSDGVQLVIGVVYQCLRFPVDDPNHFTTQDS